MNGSAISRARKIARIFGTKTSVVSWICVSACNSETATPTINPTSIRGAATSNSVTIASRATSNTSGPVIWSPFFPCSASHSLSPHAGRGKSNRHLQDVLVGRDHLVADRDQRLDCGFGFGDRGDDVDHVGLAGGHGLRLDVRFLGGLGHGVDHVFQDRAEVRPAVLSSDGAAEVCCLFAQAG